MSALGIAVIPPRSARRPLCAIGPAETPWFGNLSFRGTFSSVSSLINGEERTGLTRNFKNSQMRTRPISRDRHSALVTASQQMNPATQTFLYWV